MADFGNTGTRTVRTSEGFAIVDIDKQEFLSYRVEAKGAEPSFFFVCKHRQNLRKASDDPNHPTGTYEWKWSKTAFGDDEPNKALGDRYGVRFEFIGAVNTPVKYKLLVHHHKQDGSVATIKDIDYESQDPSDWFEETFKVYTPEEEKP